MCGIAGFNWADKDLIVEMNKTLNHRGPDDCGIYVDKVSLGHTRLSILDLSKAGHQPMCNKDGTTWITFNGEIYNYEELREQIKADYKSNTDTEVLL